VVTNATLATAKPDGQSIVVREVDHARCVMKWPLSASPAVIVDIARVEAFPLFAEGCANAANGLLNYFLERLGNS
jgi:hypothetical protein